MVKGALSSGEKKKVERVDLFPLLTRMMMMISVMTAHPHILIFFRKRHQNNKEDEW